MSASDLQKINSVMSHDKGYRQKITVTINFITGKKILEFSKTFNDFPGLENEIMKFHNLSMFSKVVLCEVIKRITTCGRNIRLTILPICSVPPFLNVFVISRQPTLPS